MASVFLRSLALLSGLLLALPPSWCCLLPTLSAEEDSSPPLCCCPAPPAPACPTQAPSPALCPCGDRDLKVPDAPAPFAPDATGLPGAVFDHAAPSAAGILDVSTCAAAASCPLHLLHCVWLC